MSKNFNKSIEEIKLLFEKITKKKEKLKIKVKKIFTRIRDTLNEKENEILLEIEEKFSDIFYKEDSFKEYEKLPNKIKISFEKELDEHNLTKFINNCINIENYIKEINKINDNIKKYHSSKITKILFNCEENKINKILEDIKYMGKVVIKESLYEDFNIINKSPISKINIHIGNVLCLTVLNDGRLVSGSRDSSIIIYNKKIYKPDIIIKNHKGAVICLCKLSSGILISCSEDNTIKLFKIKGVKYENIQTLNYHHSTVYKIIELKCKLLASCSKDSSIIFYSNNNNVELKKEYKISTNDSCSSIVQTKDNEICYSEYDDKIYFFDFLEKTIKASISNIIKRNYIDEWFIMITEILLAIPGENVISIIDVNQYKLMRIINVPGSSWIFGSCMLNKNMLLTGDRNLSIRQWRIEGDNLALISRKENSHDGDINYLLNLGNGHIASGSDYGTIIIW